MSELKRQLSGRQLFTLAFGAIVGVGWITVLGQWLDGGGPLGAVIAFVVGGVLMLVIGLCYAEIAGMMPTAGGEVTYMQQTFGPAAGFAAGWILSLVYISVTAFEAISVGWIAIVLVPELEGPMLYETMGAKVTLGGLLIGLIGMLVISFLNFRGARQAAGLQDVLTYALILITAIFITVGLIRGNAMHLKPWFASPDFSVAVNGVMALFVTTPFWFAGFNVMTQAIGERAPDVSMRRVGFMILGSIAAALLFYVLVILAASMTLPRQELLSFDLPAAAAFRVAFDSVVLGNLVLVAGLFGLITTWNAVFFSGARVLLALARSGGLPVAMATIHDDYGTPGRAVLLVMVIGIVLTFMGRGAIGLIVNTVGTCFALMFLSVVAAVIYLRVREPDRQRPFRVSGGLLLPLIGLLFALAMIITSLRVHYEATADFPMEWVVLPVWGIAGLVLWKAGAARRSKMKP